MVPKAISNSCNPYFVQLGLKIGAGTYYKYFNGFGFTEKTGIDMAGEMSNEGLYHSAGTLSQQEASLATASFGQTFKVTPIQMITAMCAIANGGKLVTPYVVSKVLDDEGNVVEVYAEYDPDTKTGMPGSNRKVKGTLHWVSCAHCIKAEVRLYDRLWKVENPRDEMAAIREEKGCDALEAMKEMINPDSLQVLTECYVERYLADAKPLDYLQFRRIGYFNVDKESTADHLVFNRTVSLKDTWSKMNK